MTEFDEGKDRLYAAMAAVDARAAKATVAKAPVVITPGQDAANRRRFLARTARLADHLARIAEELRRESEDGQRPYLEDWPLSYAAEYIKLAEDRLRLYL